MRVIKTAGDNRIVRMSKQEWEAIGKHAGWEANPYGSKWQGGADPFGDVPCPSCNGKQGGCQFCKGQAYVKKEVADQYNAQLAQQPAAYRPCPTCKGKKRVPREDALWEPGSEISCKTCKGDGAVPNLRGARASSNKARKNR